MSDTNNPDASNKPSLTLTLTDGSSDEQITLDISPEKTIEDLKKELRTKFNNFTQDLQVQNQGRDLLDAEKIAHLVDPSGHKSLVFLFGVEDQGDRNLANRSQDQNTDEAEKNSNGKNQN